MSRSDSADNLLGLHAQAQQPLHPAPAPHLNGDSDNEQAGGNDDNAVAAAAGAASDDEHKSASDGELYLNSDEEASGAQQGWGRQNTVAQRRVQFWQALKMKEVRESRIRRHTMGRKAEAVPVQEDDDADLDVSGLHGMFEMDEVDEYLAEEDQVTGYVRASDYYSPALRPWQYAIRLPAFDPDQPDTQAYRNAEVLGRWLAAHFGEESVRIRPQGSVDKESAYISIAASKEHLEELAERSKLRVRVNSWIGKGYHHYTRKAHHEKHFRIPGTELQTEEEFDAFLEAHQFSPDMPEEVMVLLPYQRQQLVLREIHSVLDRLKGLPEGSMKGMQVMIKDEELFDVFPLHTLHHEETVTDNYPSRHTVLREYCGWRTSWMTVCMWTKKSNDFLDFMRDYMGEKLALYFAFLHFYTSWLMMLAVAGSFIAIWQYSRGPDNFGVPIYCCLVALWSTIMLEYWQRRNAQLAHRWDMYDYEVREAEIENFATKVQKKYCGFYEKHGAWVDMEVWLNKQGENADEYREFVAHTHKDENGRCPPCFFWCFKPEQRLEYNTKCWRFFKVSISTTIVLCFVTGVAFVSLMWLFVRLIIQETDEQLGGSITGSMNAISILILDFLFESIAVRLNDWEGHRTATQYEDHLIAKQFFFQAVNSYFTLFYIAFFKAGPFTRGTPELFGRDDRCKDSSGEPTDSCMYELALQLTAMLITRMLLANIIEAALPKLRMWWAIRKRMQPTLKKIKWRMPNATKAEIERELRKEGMYAHVGVAEKQAHQPEYSNGLQVSGVYADMLELAIQFGYVTLFAPAFPLAPALAVLNNVIENRLDGWKVLIQCQKPDYRGARDIGTWLTVFQFLSLVGVMTNMGIVAFTSTQLDDIMNNPSDAQKLVVIIVAEHLILLVKFYFTVLIPIEPRHVRVDVAEELEIRRVLQAHTRTVEYLEAHKEETKRHPSMLASQIDFAKLVYNKREMRDMDKANELIAGMDDHTKELAARELGKTGDEEVALEDVAAREQERIEAEKAAKKAAAEAEKAAADEEPEDAGQDQE